MHVVIVTSFYPNIIDSGRAVFVRNLAVALLRRMEVTVVAPVPYVPIFMKYGKWLKYAAVPVHEEQDGIDVHHPRYLVIPGFEAGTSFGYMGGIVAKLKELRARHGDIVLHGHCVYPDGVGLAMAAEWLGLPYVLTAHGTDINVYAGKAVLRGQICWALRHAKSVVAVSGVLQDKIRGFSGVEAARIPCAGFDPGKFVCMDRQAVRTGLSLPPESKIVLFAGRFVSVKAVDVLIDAWHRLRQIGVCREHDRLVLIGDGELLPALRAQILNLGLKESVVFVGEVVHEKMPQWYSSADLFCMPSYMEGTPNVIIESLACGVPVVASRVGGIPEIIGQNQNGLLVPPGDPGQLATALREAFKRKWDGPSLRESVADYTWDDLARRNAEVLQAAAERLP